MLTTNNIKDKLQKIPQEPGVYIFKKHKNKIEEILYVGKANNLQKRLKQYFNPNSIWKQDMLNIADDIDFFIVRNQTEALQLEDNLIKTNKPIYNSLLKDNNNYVYIKITTDKFPQIFITKQRKNDNATYIGPKYNSQVLKQFLQYMRQILQYRGCKNSQFKKQILCSDYDFGICKGRCNLHLSQKINTKNAELEYKKIINKIKKFFNGNTKEIQQTIKTEIEISASKHNFERAIQLKKIYDKINDFVEKQNVIINPKINGYTIYIKEIGENIIYCIINFYKGKIIDIITNHLNKNDNDISSIKITFENEFGKQLKTNKKTQDEINILSNKFIEGYIIKQSFQNQNSIINDSLYKIKEKYGFKNFPYHIECIDISHLGGEYTSGGLSCMIGGVPNYKLYRRYKIHSIKNDDYSAIKEVIVRRFSQDENLPDLFIIDGGRGQLQVVKNIIKENKFPTIINNIYKTDIISIGKGNARKSSQKLQGKKEKIFFFSHNYTIVSKDIDYNGSEIILTKVRNEAHNYANNYRKKQISQQRKL